MTKNISKSERFLFGLTHNPLVTKEKKSSYSSFSQTIRNWHYCLYCMKIKKSSDKMLPPVGIEAGPLITSDSKYNAILSTLTWH